MSKRITRALLSVAVLGLLVSWLSAEGAADGTAGRTDVVVIYSTPETVATT